MFRHNIFVCLDQLFCVTRVEGIHHGAHCDEKKIIIQKVCALANDEGKGQYLGFELGIFRLQIYCFMQSKSFVAYKTT